MVIAKASERDGKGTLLVLGLSRGNRERLDGGFPIRVNRESHGVVMPPDLTIVIFQGETEEQMREQLSEMIGPETVVDQRRPQ